VAILSHVLLNAERGGRDDAGGREGRWREGREDDGGRGGRYRYKIENKFAIGQ